ncbi:MAG: 2-(1,2-epoxy-1,2-dihydrophenyl)acetyl-CoA isomerase [Rhodobacteraceae bacterium]|nr:2-(1,2-epoxy-1,2-dihydrophenyl)acetyl-CoA isomerase [Paracoccaceae bacterium]
MTHSEPVLAQQEAGVLLLTLNRPDRLNAFTDAMHHLLQSHLRRAAGDDAVRAVLLTGAGRGFCAGQDLGDHDPRETDAPPDLGHVLETCYNPTVRLIRALEKPVICAVNGVAAGAGANIALACDIVLAAKSARFIQSFAKIALVPDGGGSHTLPRLVGAARARALMMTGEPVGADQAAGWGMIWKAVEDGDLMAEAGTLARSLAEGPTLALGLTKRMLQASETGDLDSQLDLERDLQHRAGLSADHREGVLAFLEKRKPGFRGK